mmetsp:Transcript_24073/g.52638  ORF Transcript_24073/g.52638 Transcript_24073/m.52638 type:complete len:232 (-) Transcript_24073:411-1106(-)
MALSSPGHTATQTSSSSRSSSRSLQLSGRRLTSRQLGQPVVTRAVTSPTWQVASGRCPPSTSSTRGVPVCQRPTCTAPLACWWWASPTACLSCCSCPRVTAFRRCPSAASASPPSRSTTRGTGLQSAAPSWASCLCGSGAVTATCSSSRATTTIYQPSHSHRMARSSQQGQRTGRSRSSSRAPASALSPSRTTTPPSPQSSSCPVATPCCLPAWTALCAPSTYSGTATSAP